MWSKNVREREIGGGGRALMGRSEGLRSRRESLRGKGRRWKLREESRARFERGRGDKKFENLLMELRNANNDILENQNDVDYFKDSSLSKKHYATVSSALLNLRQRNTYTGNSASPWVKSPA
ncbi:hypothetical protein K1719_047301 [Acacia pycnantha]|nr:hypothetical protein K1719_047301 [Acacia pycnantha]